MIIVAPLLYDDSHRVRIFRFPRDFKLPLEKIVLLPLSLLILRSILVSRASESTSLSGHRVFGCRYSERESLFTLALRTQQPLPREQRATGMLLRGGIPWRTASMQTGMHHQF